ncbi:MAG: matrixin family metalloprotease [Myxococcales bacterium]|nr:matrixin family metalloprotease [Myxococcales bacterium]
MRVTLVVLAFGAAAAAPAIAQASPTPVTVHLERNGKTVTARGGANVAIPRFGGGDRAWTQLVACVKDRFAPFQVTITDRAPAGDHITAVVGGRASQLGLNDRTTNGVGPYSGEVIPDATVHVFSKVGTGERDVDNLCAVTAHEIGHALGLDHSNLCGDIMSYHNDECGTQQFLDADAACGETEDRDCANGDATQNSYRRLAALVGLRAGAPRTGPKPAGAAPTPDDPLDALDPDDASAADTSNDADDPTDATDATDGDDQTDDAAWSDDDAAWSDDDDATDDATDGATTSPPTNPPRSADPWAGDRAADAGTGTDADADTDTDADGDPSFDDGATGAAGAPSTTAPPSPDPWAGDAGAFRDDGDDDDVDDVDAEAVAPAGSGERAADQQPEQRGPRWSPRRGGWRDGRRGRWQRTEAEQPHCGR